MIRIHRALLATTGLLLAIQAHGAPITSGGGRSPIAPTPGPVTPPVVAIGGPRQPILDAPAAGAALTTALVTFDWHADPTPPAPTRYQLCITLPGGSCSDANAFVLRYLEDLYAPTPPVVTNPANPGDPTQPQLPPTQTPLTNSMFQLSLPARFVGKRFEWSVAACAPDTSRAYIGPTPPERCNYTPPRTQA